jgi:nitroreductase
MESNLKTDDLWEAMSTSRAIRRYKAEPVERAVVDRCLEAATWAPSGGNGQPWHFVLLEGDEQRKIIGEGARRSWETMTTFYGLQVPDPDDQRPRSRTVRTMYEHMAGAADVPVCILFCVQPQRGTTELEQGGSIFPAVQNFLLAARGQGLGAAICLWHRMVEPEIRSAVGIPDDWKIAATVSAGWPMGHHGPLKRQPLGAVSSVDRWIENSPVDA